ncbi:hypothetical protein SCUCBS95973_008378 [Sporothrix curviconia]|uniref:Amino acid permease/ SLC12A domain-containing protein n=1 Tax=Sporothrix curviconia TaxID=1260050 RepID=A0ABP0CL34_9PEZI
MPAQGTGRTWAQLIDKHRDDLATILTYETGKLTADAMFEIDYSVNAAKWFAAEAERIHGAAFDAILPGKKIITVKQPIGVAVALVPWNLPVSYNGCPLGWRRAAGETHNPTRAIPKAIRRVLWRLVVFYVLGAFFVGLLVPSTDPDLVSGSGVEASPWVIAIQAAGIPVLPHLINAVLITSAQRQAPAFPLQCNRQGVPYLCVAVTAVFGLLAYMTCSSTASNVFHWLSGIVAMSYLLTWTCLCVDYTRFRRACLAQGIERTSLPFRGRFQPYTAWFGIVFFCIVLLFNGFAVFTHGNWDAQDFVSAYVGLPIFSGFYVFWKVVKTKVVPLDEMDLYTGRVMGDERDFPDQKPKTKLQKVMSKIL